ncbi:MAG TPA: hypothetical protein PLH91_00080 [Tenuifilaceae bacterium]|nr:hypothetical protein [Tenuifilaceae bacterium]HPI43601.1 hypothetical protein [Tenuifilaceae bacterium]HPN22861.1 hypothetical protein [Tenuifilaceae bacterium]
MNLQKVIEEINQLELNARISRINELLEVSNYYVANNPENRTLAYDIIDCINGMRQSRFIETREELDLIKVSLEISRLLDDKKKMLTYLVDLSYYADYYPDKYNKQSLDEEIEKIESFLRK